jgi:hypothetical protein
VLLLVVAAVFVLFLVGPLIGAVRREQWVWALAIFFLAPVAGVLWCFVGRQGDLARRRALAATTR